MRNLFLIIFFVQVACVGCKKSSYNAISHRSSLNVINAASDVPSLNINFTSNPLPYALYQQPISYPSSWEWSLPPGDSPIVIISSTDTSHPLYQGKISLEPEHIYSLYVLNSAQKDNILFLEDTIPLHVDSAAGVRFINLAIHGHPITINLQDNPPGNTEFDPLSYKQISAFRNYDASAGNINAGLYTFELRDQETNEVLTTYSWQCKIFKNSTLVICGSMEAGTSVPLNVLEVNNF